MARSLVPVLLLFAGGLLAGCSRYEELDTTYGQRRGASAGPSVNGTRVFAKMFEAAGHRVTGVKYISPHLENYDVIVWFPDDFQPPTERQRRALEQWLAGGADRTLIYVGRDYDAAVDYWERVEPSTPPEQLIEVKRQLARSKAAYHTARQDMPEKEYCRWFTVRREGGPRRVNELEGPWSADIDPEEADLFLWGRLDAPTAADLSQPAQPDGSDPFDLEFEFEFDSQQQEYDDAWQYGPMAPDRDELPDEVAVLLASRGVPLVTRVEDAYWQPPSWEPSTQGERSFFFSEPEEPPPAETNRLFVVTNGSFLLNFPLVNHEHRKLAGKLIAECGNDRRVAFLESGPGGPQVLLEEPSREGMAGLEALTTWPLSCILLHLAAAGILYCFARFPIFGRPRQLEPEGTSDFGRHVQSLGRLLQRTGHRQYAAYRIRQYQQLTRSEAETAGPTRPPSGPRSRRT